MKKIVLIICLFQMMSSATSAQSLVDSISIHQGQEGQLIFMTVYSSQNSCITGDYIGFSKGLDTVFWSEEGEGKSKYNNNRLETYLKIPHGTVGVYDVLYEGYQHSRPIADTIQNGFTVTASPIAPSLRTALMRQKLKFTINGINTHFTSAGFGTNISLRNAWGVWDTTIIHSDSILVINDTVLTCFMNIPDTIPVGEYDLLVEDSVDGILEDYNSIFITNLTGVFPSNLSQGKSYKITLTALPGTFSATDKFSTSIYPMDPHWLFDYWIYEDSVRYQSSDTVFIYLPPIPSDYLLDKYLLALWAQDTSPNTKLYPLYDAFTLSSFKAHISSIKQSCLNMPIAFYDSSISKICGTINKWQWDFGDGTKDTVQNPSHTYNKEGNYKVKLRINSVGGCIDSTFQTIKVSSFPKAKFSVNDTGCMYNVFLFHDSSLACIGAIKYHWDFGDGKMDTIRNPSHIFTKSSSFKVELKIESMGGSMDSITKTIFVNPAPKAGISSPYFDCINSSVQFFAQNVADYYLWDFGDGLTSTQKNPAHIYTKAGTFNVKLVVGYNGGCADSMIKTTTITPLPIITWKLTNPNGRDIDFVVLDTSFKSYLWDLGDSISSTSFHQLHTYKKDGVYDVKLIVEDSFGCTSEKDTQITIANTSLPPTLYKANSLRVSPNPFSSTFNISFNLSSTTQTKIQLCDLDGRVIKEVYYGMLKEGRNELQLSCPLPFGIYMLRLVTKEGVMNSRVVKME